MAKKKKPEQMTVQMIPISKIKPYEKNPRVNDGAVNAVVESIKRYGFRQPLVVDKDMVVVVGHTRLKAAIALGMKNVPVHIAKELTKEQAKAYRLVDNRTNEIAIWNLPLLKIEVGEIGFDSDAESILKFNDVLAGMSAGEVPPPDLEDGDREPFRQVTFTMHDDQFNKLEAAIEKAKADGHGESPVNENSNGNALAWIAEVFIRG